VVRQEIETTRRDLEVTWREFESQLAAVEAWKRRGSGNVGTSSDRLKPQKFDGSQSWAVFHRQFEAAADDKWKSCKKAAHLLAVLQGQVSDVLQHNVPVEATYKNIVGSLKNRYGDHQLAAAHRAPLKD
jgi:hypothetical protein